MAIILYFLTPLLINSVYFSALVIIGFSLSNILRHGFYSVNPLHIFTLSLISIVILNLFALFKIFTKMIIIIRQIRDITHNELQRLEPLLVNLINKTNQLYNTNYTMDDFIIKVLPAKDIEYFTIGSNAIIISDGVFNLLDTVQQEALLSNLLATLYLNYGIKNNFLLLNIVVSNATMWVAKSGWQLLRSMYKVISRLSRIIYTLLLIPFGLISIVFLMFYLITMLCNSLIKINEILFKGLMYKYADKFSLSLNYKDGLISLLEFSNLNYLTNEYDFIINYVKSFYSPVFRINQINKFT